MSNPPRRRSRSRSTRGTTPKFTLAPRRLEPRRMLDAAASALALETVAVGAAFTPASDDAASAPPVANLSGNTAPSNIDIQTPIVINENGVATLSLTFDDPDAGDSHTIFVDWKDGSTQTFNLAAGQTSFTTTHQYLDDNLPGPATEDYDVTVRVTDAAGEFTEVTSKITVNNVAPSNLQLAPITPINENGVATLKLTFDDPGTLDAHTVEVNWGDGSPLQVYTVPTGDRTFTATHQYLDDNPTGTPSDSYTVSVRLIDDDLGQTTATTTATVNNVAPSNVKVTPVASILDEGGQVALTVTFDDAGTQDTHQVEINWGDGNTTITSVAGHSLNVNHTYGDNATYAIIVKVIDDDGGVGFGSAAALVKNVPPANVKIDPIATIDENGVAVLKLTFDDPGTLDAHTVDVDWGDGTIETIAVAAGSRTLTATHQYLDDNPTGTSSDVYAVKVTVRDDDGGQATGSATVQVVNVPPSNVKVTPVANIVDEGSQVALTVTFDDAGSQDTHQVEINWGDGNVTIASAVGHSLNVNHTYGDNGNYAIVVKVIDDDGGVGFGSAAALVKNVPPSNVKIDPIATIDENGVATLKLTFDDPGSLDTHTVEIDWGDGTIETVAVAAGSRTLTATHQYLDDNPTGTSSDVYAVKVTVRDDDGGQAVGNATVQVNNVAPSNVVATPVASIITEGSQASLEITFDDAGSQDTHTVEITWGDGHVTIGTATGHTFSASHTYADDGTYAVHVKVIDDDGGVGNGSAAVHVNNVAPTLVVPGPQTVNEGGVLSIPNIGQFTDPGFNNPLNAGNILNGGETTEEFTYEINWGDGSANSTGSATIDQPGSPGTPTAGSFDGTHVYADNGVYTVTVTVRDDNGGETSKTFQVTVNNVDPSLTFQNPNPTVNEGSPVTLAGLGVGATDPGFKNDATGTNETLIGESVDWGDGTGPQPLSIATTPGGGPTNAPTTGTFSHANHYYADNGTYTVTVRMRDDDGGFVDRTFTIVVENVAPSLELTDKVLVVKEGSPLIISDLGKFTDPGFDNPANAGNGETEETFYYTIDWGDGSGTSAPIAVSKTDGGPNALTTGSFGNSHTYLDNDADNVYTITVTLYDDDGGVVVRTIDVTVKNVNPTLKPLIATDVNNKGETTLTVQFSDPGADTFHVLVDWGDGNVDCYHICDVGNGQVQTYTFTHKYTGPPNPANPTGDITLTVQVFDDDFGTLGMDEVGASEELTVDISQPGLGAEKFRIDTSPQVAILTFPDRQVVPLLPTAADARLATVVSTDDGGGGGDTRAASERYLELCVINPDGSPGQRFRLPSNVLNNLPALFKNLPDNHYVIYLVQSETNARRLVIDVFVRNGKLIDPGDDSEGARDRPPTEEATERAIDEQPAAVPAGDEAAAVETPEAQQPLADAGVRPRSSTAIYHGATLAGVALALSGAGQRSRLQIEEALARAKPDQWKRLRSTALGRPKKPR